MLNENLIQSLTAYTSTLEQQLAALEARVAQLEEQLHNCKLASQISKLEQQLADQTTLIEALAARPTPQPEEPEIEIELVMEDEEDKAPFEPEAQETLEKPDTLEETIEPESVMEPVVESIVEPEPASVADPAEPAPAVEQTLVSELAPHVQEPRVAAPVVEKPAPRPTPQQTSLFGTAVEDIRQAISLGDRFLFQRELFGGNGELMQKTLDEINGLDSLNEAMEYIADTFEWDNESTAVKLFENVLKRRFP